MLARQLPERNREMHNKIWNKESANCYEVRGKTVGIIGYGHVGSQLSVLCEALGMSVYYYDIVPKLTLGNAKSSSTLEEVLSVADFVTLHVPATPDTVKLIGPKEIGMMKKGSFLLNASRGQVVDIDSAVAGLHSGQLSGAAFDVFPEEPTAKGDEFKSGLIDCRNTILTPHIGGSTEEAQAAIGKEVASKMRDFINQGITIGSVNLPELHLAVTPLRHRILNIHRNVPGVLRDINNVISNYNVEAQILMTKGPTGYLIIEVDRQVSHDVKEKIGTLPHSIRTRILY